MVWNTSLRKLNLFVSLYMHYKKYVLKTTVLLSCLPPYNNYHNFSISDRGEKTVMDYCIPYMGSDKPVNMRKY